MGQFLTNIIKKMVSVDFYLKNDERMEKIKLFIRQNMPTARFVRNPYRLHNGTWSVLLFYEIEDINKLNLILEEFYLEDNPLPVKKESVFKRILKWF